jgi:hypothetical protein
MKRVGVAVERFTKRCASEEKEGGAAHPALTIMAGGL